MFLIQLDVNFFDTVKGPIEHYRIREVGAVISDHFSRNRFHKYSGSHLEFVFDETSRRNLLTPQDFVTPGFSLWKASFISSLGDAS